MNSIKVCYRAGLNYKQKYIPRGQNVLQQIFKDHFENFKEQYDEKYAKTYGNYRIDRISEVVEEFLKCRIGTRRLDTLQY